MQSALLMFSSPIPVDDDARIAALLQYSILDTAPEQGYDDVTAVAAYICGTPFATVTLVDRERQWFKSEVGFGRSETNREGGFCACAILRPETMVVEDTLLDPRFAENPFVLSAPRIRFYAGAPLITPGGYILGTVCVFDTEPRSLATEQIGALEALARQVMAQLELRLKVIESERTAEALRTAEKLAAVGRLASAMAHEINNPLQSVINMLYMMEASEPEGTRILHLAQAQEELMRVSQIVTQTLRFHQQSVNPARIRLRELVDSVLTLYRSRLRQASVTVAVDDRQTATLLCYGSDVRQVIANLIGNAVDAAAGSGEARIAIRIREAVHPNTGAPGVRLTVADSGCGMDATTQERMFEPFFSTKGARSTGLGLWVSKGILKKHNARAQVKSSQSVEAHGTVFAIFFPRDGNCG